MATTPRAPRTRRRPWLLAALAAVVALGLLSRRHPLPGILAEYTGDALYTVAAETIQKHQSRNLIVTVPIVVYGVYRYQYLVSQGREVGDPARVLFRDRPLVLSGLAYALVVWLAITLRPLL